MNVNEMVHKIFLRIFFFLLFFIAMRLRAQGSPRKVTPSPAFHVPIVEKVPFTSQMIS